jgi:hypothetical protein
VKINVDGAVSRHEDHGSFSAICRDEFCHFVGASARTVKGISHPATLEAMACAEALSLAADLGMMHIQISSDCLEVINELKKGTLGPYGSILIQIRTRTSSFTSVSFVHENRDANGDAHLIARNALGQPFGRRLWLLNPPYDVMLDALE